MRCRVRLIQDTAGLQQLEQDWTDLLLRMPVPTVFSSYQWNAVWWRHFGAGAKLFVLVVSDGSGRTVAIAPLIVRRHGPIRKLEFIGTGLSDYGDFLVDPSASCPALEAIFAYLSAHHRDWDLADCSEIPTGSPLLNYFSTKKSKGLHALLVPHTNCSVITLPSTWEEYISSLPRKRRYYVGSFPRKFLGEHDGDLIVTATEPAVTEAVDTFHTLHLARWDEKNEVLSREHRDPAFGPFLQDVCRQLADRRWLQLVSLRAEGRTIASSINFLVQGRWNSYMKGFDPAWSKTRPGTVLDALRVKQAIALGASWFDFGRGDEAYKSGFGGTYRRNSRVLVVTRSPRSVAAFVVLLLRISYRKLKSRFQQGAQLEENSVNGEVR